MTRRPALATLLAGAVVLAALLITDPSAARVVLAVAACLLLPGLGWARKMHIGDRGDTLALAVVLSICLTVAVGTAMALADRWSLGWGLGALGLVALAGFVPAQALADRAAAAARLRTAGFGDDNGAWADWFAETQQARTRRGQAEVAAREASDVWVDWYTDVERRAEEARAQEAAAAQQATDQWVAWNQGTQTPTHQQDSQE